MATRLQRLYVSALFLLLVGNIWAQRSAYSTYADRKPRHYLGISFGGGEANNLTDTIKHLGGAGAGLGLHYEVQCRSWIFGMSLEAQYQYLRDRVNPFTDEENSLRIYNVVDPAWPTPFQDSVSYKYEYSDYLETSHHGSVALSVYGGKEFINAMYLLLGAKLTIPIPVITSYHAKVALRTSARYSWAIEDLRDLGLFQEDELHDYGVFDEKTYQKPILSSSDYIRIAPFIELGYNIPLPSDKTRMRVGVYGTYGFRLGKNPKNQLADYTAVKREWGRDIQSPEMLQETIQWNPLNQSDRYATLPHNLEIGAKLTILFDVTTQKQICHCTR